MSYTRNLQHITFSTKGRKKVLSKYLRADLFKAFGATLKNHKCIPVIINGVEDHVHILCIMHPSISMADLVKKLKLESHSFIKNKFPESQFDYWNEGYASFCVEHKSLQTKYDYIANQEAHHKTIDSLTELKSLLAENGVDYDPQYLV